MELEIENILYIECQVKFSPAFIQAGLDDKIRWDKMIRPPDAADVLYVCTVCMYICTNDCVLVANAITAWGGARIGGHWDKYIAASAPSKYQHHPTLSLISSAEESNKNMTPGIRDGEQKALGCYSPRRMLRMLVERSAFKDSLVPTFMPIAYRVALLWRMGHLNTTDRKFFCGWH